VGVGVDSFTSSGGDKSFFGLNELYNPGATFQNTLIQILTCTILC
jgi:hypothetical protein